MLQFAGAGTATAASASGLPPELQVATLAISVGAAAVATAAVQGGADIGKLLDELEQYEDELDIDFESFRQRILSEETGGNNPGR